MCNMQVTNKKDGSTRPARSPTAEEMADFIMEVLDYINSHKYPYGSEPTADKPFPSTFIPLISLDNAAVHMRLREVFPYSAECGVLNPIAFNQCSPPPYSPDMHKVIEHPHGTICSALNRWLERRKTNLPNIWEVFKKLEQLFYQLITPESVQKDIKSLKCTFKKVVQLKGAWPPRKYR